MFRPLSIAVIGMLGLGRAFGAPCLSETAANYVTNFSGASGCTISSGTATLLFSNFSFIHNASGPTSGGAATQVTLNPLVDANGLGFDILPTSLFSASATGVSDFELQFVASVIAGEHLIRGIYLSITGSAGASGVGGGQPGNDSLYEMFCRGGSIPAGSCPDGQGGTLVDFLTITGPASGVTLSKTNTFQPTSALSVFKDVQLNGINGDALSSVTEVKNQILLTSPEPSALGLTAIGCCALIFQAWRRRKLALL